MTDAPQEPPGEKERSRVPMKVSHRKVMFRDLLIFQLKLVLDGLKDLVMMPLSVGAFLFDILPGSDRRGGRTFYAVMRAGEHFDRWLSLYDATERVETRSDGLFGGSLAGANTLIGRIEAVLRKGVEVGKEQLERAREQEDGEPGESEDGTSRERDVNTRGEPKR